MTFDDYIASRPDADEIRRLRDRYVACQPDPYCVTCEGTGTHTFFEGRPRRWWDRLLRRPPRVLCVTEVCPDCMAPQWEAIDADEGFRG